MVCPLYPSHSISLHDAQILLLFRQKDEELESLRQQLIDQEKIIETYREISNTNKDLLKGPTMHHSTSPSPAMNERTIEENKRLNEELIEKCKEVRQLSGLRDALAEKSEQLEVTMNPSLVFTYIE